MATSQVLLDLGAAALRIALLAYAGLLVVLYLTQDRLIFYPQPLAGDGSAVAGERAEEIRLAAADGTRLHGWLVHARGPGPAPLILYFGGNAEEVSWLVTAGPWPADWSVALVNYRGYGLSEGRPGERALHADARAIYDRLTRRPDIDASRVVAFGRSLGSGVAVRLAAERRLAGVVLVTAYDSLRAVAAGVYPWVPVGWLLRHPFDSLALAPARREPALFLAGGADTVIPAAHARRLYAAWGGPKEWHLIEGAGHDDIAERTAYYDTIAAFLAGLR